MFFVSHSFSSLSRKSVSLLVSFICLLALTCGASASVILVDLGATTNLTIGLPQTWNNITGTAVGSAGSSVSLLDSTGQTTGFTLAVTAGFDASNIEGITGTGILPDSVSIDTLYGSGTTNGTGNSQLTLSGLSSSLTYDLTFWAAIKRDTSTRATQYSVGADSVTLNNQYSTVAPGGGYVIMAPVTLYGLTADANNQIIIDITRAPVGNAAGTYFIGSLQIETHAIPEPGRAVMLAMGCVVLICRRKRSASTFTL